MFSSRWLPVSSVLLLAVAGCAGQDEPADPAPSPSMVTSGAAPATPTTPSASERLGLTTGWGPTRRQLDRAARAVRDLSLEQLAGQTIVARYDGTAAPTALVRDLHLGGVVVFSDNIGSTDQIRDVNAQLRREVRRDWPLWVSVDQEGGVVQRVEGQATRFPAFMSAGAADEADLTRAAAAAMGAELRGLGFNVDFAPIADVTTGPDDPTIGSRSAGSDPALVARHARAAASGLQGAGVLPVVKHFPGHGSVAADSHETLPVQTRTQAQLAERDLVPFREAVAAGVPAVMVAHLALRAVDPRVPSSLSHRVVTGALRDGLGFDGLVVSDALDMAGVAATHDSAASAVAGLAAGVDLLLMPPDPAVARDGIIAAVRDGRLARKRLEQAAARQIALLLHTEAVGRDGAGPGSGAGASYRLSAGAITVVAGPCRGALVGPSVTPTGDPEAVATFSAAAREAGLRVGGGKTVALIGYGGGPVAADIAVATDAPYPLGASRAPVRIATYGDTPGAMRALVEVLLGKRRAPGRLPVRVAGADRTGCS